MLDDLMYLIIGIVFGAFFWFLVTVATNEYKELGTWREQVSRHIVENKKTIERLRIKIGD